MHNSLEECLLYFQKRPIYRKVFEHMQKKYESLGHLGGTFVLQKVTQKDLDDLSGFLQKNLRGQKSVTISYQAMQDALQSSRYADFSWEEILESYFGEALESKKMRKQLVREERESFFTSCIDMCQNQTVKKWITDLLAEKGSGYHLLQKQYQDDKNELRNVLKYLFMGLQELQIHQEKELIPVFSARITGDPHYFDQKRFAGQLLGIYIDDHFSHIIPGNSLEKKMQRYFKAGLIMDSLSNHTLIYGFHGVTNQDKLHQGMEGFLKEKEALQLTLQSMANLKKVYPQKEKKVYIFENPALFYHWMKQYPDDAVVCGNGQLRTATWILLDLLSEDVSLFYAGDFDPEGLLIAQNMKENFGDRLSFWKYEIDLYHKYQSKSKINDQRLKKLDKIKLDELLGLKEAMLQCKYATYQESMLQELFKTIKT